MPINNMLRKNTGFSMTNTSFHSVRMLCGLSLQPISTAHRLVFPFEAFFEIFLTPQGDSSILLKVQSHTLWLLQSRSFCLTV